MATKHKVAEQPANDNGDARAAELRDAAARLIAGVEWADLPLPEELGENQDRALDVSDFLAAMFSRPSGPTATERAALARMAKAIGPALVGEKDPRVARAIRIVEDHAERLNVGRRGDGPSAIAEGLLVALGNVDPRFRAPCAPDTAKIVDWLRRYDAKSSRVPKGRMRAARIVAEIASKTGALDVAPREHVADVTHKLIVAARRSPENR